MDTLSNDTNGCTNACHIIQLRLPSFNRVPSLLSIQPVTDMTVRASRPIVVVVVVVLVVEVAVVGVVVVVVVVVIVVVGVIPGYQINNTVLW